MSEKEKNKFSWGTGIVIGIIVSITFLAVITARITSALIEFIRVSAGLVWAF